MNQAVSLSLRDGFMSFITTLLLLLGLGFGMALGYILRKLLAVRSRDAAEVEVAKIIATAKNQEKDILIQAKEKGLKIIEEAKKEEQERRKDVQHLQDRLEKRESAFDQKLLELEGVKQKAEEEKQKFETAREEVKKIREEQMLKLEKIARLSEEEAKQVMFSNL